MPCLLCHYSQIANTSSVAELLNKVKFLSYEQYFSPSSSLLPTGYIMFPLRLHCLSEASSINTEIAFIGLACDIVHQPITASSTYFCISPSAGRSPQIMLWDNFGQFLAMGDRNRSGDLQGKEQYFWDVITFVTLNRLEIG